VKSGNNVGLDGLARNLASIVKVFDGGSVWASQVLTHQTHPTMDLALWGTACWNRKGPSSNCSHKVGSIALFKMLLYAKALRFVLNGCKRPSSKTALAHTTVILIVKTCSSMSHDPLEI